MIKYLLYVMSTVKELVTVTVTVMTNAMLFIMVIMSWSNGHRDHDDYNGHRDHDDYNGHQSWWEKVPGEEFFITTAADPVTISSTAGAYTQVKFYPIKIRFDPIKLDLIHNNPIWSNKC